MSETGARKYYYAKTGDREHDRRKGPIEEQRRVVEMNEMNELTHSIGSSEAG